jgi:hypothetical protein
MPYSSAMCLRRPARVSNLGSQSLGSPISVRVAGHCRHGVDDGDVAVAARHDLELGALALAAGRRSRRVGTGGRLPVDPLQHFGERHATEGGFCPASRAASAAVRPVNAVRPAAIGRLVAAQPQRLAVRLAHHVQQAAQRQQDELADRVRRGVHLDRESRDLDRRGAARARHRRDRGRLLEQHRVGRLQELGEAGAAASLARSSTSERFEVLRNWNNALSPCGRRGGAWRTGSPPAARS